MDPEGFPTSFFRWDLTKGVMTPQLTPPLPPPAYAYRLGGLEELFGAYGIRCYTAARIAELGFTANTMVNMREEELDEMMDSVSHIFRWELLVGERYGIKAAVRAERRRLQDALNGAGAGVSDSGTLVVDSLSQEGLSEEPVQQEKEAAGSGGIATWQVSSVAAPAVRKKHQSQQRGGNKKKPAGSCDASLDGGDDVDGEDGETGEGILERQREHPFIVTEPGEVARGKKNGLDYLFHLYDQCREFLVQVQNIAKERGEKCPTKVTNQVFRYAKKAGATYINKPKMRHYVHCYALHCLDEEASNELRKAYKERGENVGAWRQACYKPLVAIAARPHYAWDIDALFNSHPRLSVWYVPTRLRQLCHAHRNAAGGGDPLMVVPSSAVSPADHQILPPY